MDETISKEFSEISLSRTGVLVTRYFGAYFRLKSDLRFLFPYINASIADTRYYDRPEYLQFFFEGIKCSLYPNELIAASFVDEPSAISFFHRFMDFVEDIRHRRDTIQPDYRKYRPPSILDILKLLPKSNCRACGYPTCMAFAAALRNGEVAPGDCPDFVSPINIRNIYPVVDDEGRLVSTVTIDIDIPDETDAVSPSNRVVPTDPADADKTETPNRSSDTTVRSHTSGNESAIVAVHEPDGENGEIGTPPLTQREIQVLKYITEGATNIEIADSLGISPHTVKSHVVHIFNKLGVNDRTQAAVWATRYHLQN